MQDYTKIATLNVCLFYLFILIYLFLELNAVVVVHQANRDRRTTTNNKNNNNYNNIQYTAGLAASRRETRRRLGVVVGVKKNNVVNGKMMLGSILHEVKTFVNKHDDDLIDRYNHRYTVMILAIFIFLIASKQYFGEPIIW